MAQRSRDGAATRVRILETALDLFSKQGFEATTTRQITGGLGITPAALYYHFRGKSECLYALVEPYLDQVEALVTSRSRPVATRIDARRFLADYRRVLVDNSAVARLVDSDAAVVRHPRLGDRIQSLTERLRAVLAGPDHDEGGDEEGLVRVSAALGAIRRPALRLESSTRRSEAVAVAAALAALESSEQPFPD